MNPKDSRLFNRHKPDFLLSQIIRHHVHKCASGLHTRTGFLACWRSGAYIQRCPPCYNQQALAPSFVHIWQSFCPITDMWPCFHWCCVCCFCCCYCTTSPPANTNKPQHLPLSKYGQSIICISCIKILRPICWIISTSYQECCCV